MRLHVAVALACVLAIGVAAVAAQDGREIRGKVEDWTGGVIVGATIRAEASGGSAVDAVTDNQGRYRLAALPAGVYVVTIKAPGFADFVVTVNLTSRRVGALDARLPIALRRSATTIRILA